MSELIDKHTVDEGLYVYLQSNSEVWIARFKIGGNPLVFRLPDGTTTDGLGRNFTALLRRLKLDQGSGGKRTLYSLRHTYITHRLLDRMPVSVIAKQCGTSTAMIETHYSHITPLMYAKELAGGEGTLMAVRYGAKQIELSKGRNAIECGSMEDLVAALEAVKEAVAAGELDAQIEQASGALRAGFAKKR